jgi:tRNA(Leu) C34 or U34 (ribose-2'-O)-methylase TrmL
MMQPLLLQSLSRRTTVTIMLLITLLLVAIPAAVDALSSSSSSVRNTINSSVSQEIINRALASSSLAAAAIPTLTSTASVVPKIKIKTKFILIDTTNCGNIGSSARAMKTMGFNTNLVLVSPKDGLSVKNKKRAKESTSGAIDVLNNAKIFNTLEEALLCPFDDEIVDDDAADVSSKEALIMGDDDDDENDNDNENIINIVCGTGMPIDMSREREEQIYIPPRQFFEELLLSTAVVANNDKSSTTTTKTTPKTNITCTIHISILFGNEKYGMNINDINKYCNIMLGIPTNPKFGSLNLASAVQIIAYDWRMAIIDSE